MRVLFFIRHHGYVRNFESTLERLADRGHEVVLAFSRDPKAGYGPAIEGTRALAERCPQISLCSAPPVPATRWEHTARELRDGVNWLRHLRPELASARKARARTEKSAPRTIRWAGRAIEGRPRAVQRVTAFLQGMEALTPVREADVEFVARHDPDLAVFTPLLGDGPQTGYLRAVKAHGVPSVACVTSWDNLTRNGPIFEQPDLMAVWNEAMVEEGVTLHGLPPERLVATGAQAYDHWFGWRPTTTREAFCASAGLDPQRPFVVYMCSSGFIGGHEADHVEGWIAALRSSEEPQLREAGVLVRPHPGNSRQWEGRDLSRFGNAALWRLQDIEPATQRAREEYFDTIHHSAAVVGLNSSALIEAAVIDRPVLTLLTPEYAPSQEGTPHFELIAGEDGMMIVARSEAEHHRQLLAALRDPGYEAGRRARFVEHFVRPLGTDVPATDVLVGHLERLGTGAVPPPAADDHRTRLLRAAAAPVVYAPRLSKERTRRWRRHRHRARKLAAQALAVVRPST